MRVIVMCKAPVAGRVKSRLSPRFTPAEAAALHAGMAAATIEKLCGLFHDVRIAADDPAHPFFARFGLPLIPQGEGDLGARMCRQLREAGGPALIAGTDSPHMPTARLRAVAPALACHDVVIGPVEDGGYDLIAANAPQCGLFEGVAWSSARVTRQTLAAAERLGLRYALLEEGFDIDSPADLVRAAACGWRPDDPALLHRAEG